MSALGLEYFQGDGVFIRWDWSMSDPTITKARVSRADYAQRTGTYTELETVDFPINYYVDDLGTTDSYYLIEELDDTDTVIYTHAPLWGNEALLRTGIYYEIGMFFQVNSRYERVRFTRNDRTQGRLAMPNWNFDPEPLVEMRGVDDGYNQGIIMLSREESVTTSTVSSEDSRYPNYPNGLKYDIDFNGNIYFTDADGDAVQIWGYDDIYCTYTFKFVSTNQVNAALQQALSSIVAQAGVNKGYGIHSTPWQWNRALICGATGILLRQIALHLLIPEPAVFLSFSQNPDDIARDSKIQHDAINTKSKEYMEEFEKLRKDIATERYPRIGINVTPEFQLPGGRVAMNRLLWK